MYSLESELGGVSAIRCNKYKIMESNLHLTGSPEPIV